VRIQSEALVVRNVAYGESDAIVTLVTKSHGKVAAMVRGGRKSSRRVGGALEPLHTIDVALDDKGGELMALREARVVRVRQGIAGSLDALDAAGVALRWVRHLFPVRTPEPEGWAVLIALLDGLDAGAEAPRASLAAAGLKLLGAVGYALDLDRCVVCGKPCPDGKPSAVDATRGGLVCRSCGGASRVLDAKTRAAARALQRGEPAELDAKQASLLLEIVDGAMAAHAGYEK
jgi:DNA repair protein RecO (recombination protein O)